MTQNPYIIYHNPRCRKSRETLELLMHQCTQVKVIDYLKTPPDEKELKAILKKLGMKAADLVRKSEALYKESYKDKELSEDQWVSTMVRNPILIERPIVVHGDRAIIGRPPETVNQLI